MLGIVVRVPQDREQTGVVEIRSNLKTVARGVAVASASRELAARHGNPNCDPLRPWGHPPLGMYRYLAQGPAPAGCDIEYGRQLLVFQPETGKALEAEAFGRLLLLVYAGPAEKDGRLRRTQGGVRLDQKSFDAMLAALAPDPLAVLSIEVLQPPAWWQFWRRGATTLPLAAQAPKFSAPPLDEASLAAQFAQGKRLPLKATARPHDIAYDSDSDSDSSSGYDPSDSSYSDRGGTFGGAGASGGWGVAGSRVDSAGRITTAAAGAALAAGAFSASESGTSPSAAVDCSDANTGTQTGTSY
jgi:uncharacterized membrane protein YgcG